MFLRNPLKDDPGPCPVDDAPHHTCVPPDYPGADRRAVVVRPITPATTVTVPVPAARTVATFTTSTYRREVHGPAALAKKAARRSASRKA